MSLRFPLRITLLVTNLFIFLVTFGIIWLSATQGLEGSVYNMAENLTRETTSRVKQEANMPLHEARVASQLATRQLQDNEKSHKRALTINDSDEIILQLHDIMVALPRLTFLSCSFASRGEYLHVERRDRQLQAVKVVRQPNGNAWHYTYLFTENHLRLLKVRRKYSYDPRQRPYYKAAVAAHKPIWTDPYLFINVQGIQYPGLSLATPIYGANGQLRYVLTADFSCQAISEYLGQIHIGDSGYAYVVAKKASGTLELIAHPRPAVMLEKRNGVLNLVDAQHLTDPVLRSVLPWVSRTANQYGGKFAMSSQLNGQEFFLGYESLEGGIWVLVSWCLLTIWWDNFKTIEEISLWQG